MGSIGSRVTRLEERHRERAVEDLRRAWDTLSDEEVALLYDPYTDAQESPDGRLRFACEATPAQRMTQEKMRFIVPEELIARAIGLAEEMDSKEVDRRMKALVGRLGIFERGEGVRHHMRAAREG